MRNPLPVIFDALLVAVCLAAAAVHFYRSDYAMAVNAVGFCGLLSSNISKDSRIDALEAQLRLRGS